jgi:hypothetical protein
MMMKRWIYYFFGWHYLLRNSDLKFFEPKRSMVEAHQNLCNLAKYFLAFALIFFTQNSYSAKPELSSSMADINNSKIFTSKHILGANKVSVRIYRINPGQPRAGLTYVVIESSSESNSPHVAIVKKFGESYRIYVEQTPKDAIAAINGGFFGYSPSGAYMQLGLIVAAGKRENSQIGWTRGGVFVHSKDGTSKIVPIRKYVHKNTDVEVIQSKPLLVEEFRSGIFSDDGERFNRTAIAITKSGKVILSGAFDSFGRGVSLYEMAEFLRVIRGLDGSGVRWAIAMDGGPGAQLYIPSLNLNFGEQGQNFVPNILYLK